MNSIGERLREERLRRGFTIEQIAESTKINASLLEAIEADDLERLPGTFFTRSFVRQYAAALGIDKTELESELDRVAAPEPVNVPLPEPKREPIDVPPVDSGVFHGSGSSRPLGALISFLLIVGACSGLYILWQQNRQARSAAVVPPEPAASHQAAPKPAEPKTVPVSAPPAAALQATAPAPQPTQPEPQKPPEQAAAPQQQAAAPASPQQPPSATPPAQPGAVTIEVRAIETVWIRLAADGKFLFSGTLQANETRKIEAAQLIQLRTGNAAGLEVLFDGKPVGSLGSEGQVRNLEFTPGGFKIVAPPAPKPAPPADGL